jgi:hypothetical protein
MLFFILHNYLAGFVFMPNSLTDEKVASFLGIIKDAHYARYFVCVCFFLPSHKKEKNE